MNDNVIQLNVANYFRTERTTTASRRIQQVIARMEDPMQHLRIGDAVDTTRGRAFITEHDGREFTAWCKGDRFTLKPKHLLPA